MAEVNLIAAMLASGFATGNSAAPVVSFRVFPDRRAILIYAIRTLIPVAVVRGYAEIGLDAQVPRLILRVFVYRRGLPPRGIYATAGA